MPVKVVAPTGSGGGWDAPRGRRRLPGQRHASRSWPPTSTSTTAVHWTNSYAPERLRWRLARPHGDYVVHVDDDLVVVSTRSGLRTGAHGCDPQALPPGPRPTDEPLSARQAIAAVCRHHRAPAAVYAGFNALVQVRGVQPPHRLRPAPLNLVVHSFSDRSPRRPSAWIPSSSSTSTPTDRARPSHDPALHLHLRRRGPPTRRRRPSCACSTRPTGCWTSVPSTTSSGRSSWWARSSGTTPAWSGRSPTRATSSGLHGWRHTPITELTPEAFREETAPWPRPAGRGERPGGGRLPGTDVLPDVPGDRLGHRGPGRARVHLLLEHPARRGARCSASPACPGSRSPGRPGWPSCPAPILKVGPLGLPVVGGTYLRVLPWPIVRLGLREQAARPGPVHLLPPLRRRPRRALLGGARHRPAAQPAALVRPQAHAAPHRAPARGRRRCSAAGAVG